LIRFIAVRKELREATRGSFVWAEPIPTQKPENPNWHSLRAQPFPDDARRMTGLTSAFARPPAGR